MNKKDLVLTTINRIPTLTGILLTEGTVRIEGTHFVGSVDYHYNSGKVSLTGVLNSDISTLKDKVLPLSVILRSVAGRVEVSPDYFPYVYELSLIHLINNPEVK